MPMKDLRTAMPLVSNAKSVLRRSIHFQDPPKAKTYTTMGLDVTSRLTDPVTIAVIGCGQRGQNYSVYALSDPTKCKVVAIAEPRPKTRKQFAETHKVDETLVFNTWQELHKASADTIKTVGKRLADAVIVAVQDQMHLEVTLAFAEQGYHILCEKPMSTNLEDCLRMEAAVKKAGVIFGMGHVLRYSPYTQAITEIIRSGTLGQLINAVHIEPVGYYHFAHSYVRGNWAREEDSCFSLMTKSCHDIDILCHWLSPGSPTRVSSFGSLQHFRKVAKPPEAGAVTRCWDCKYERECPYSAKKIYLEPVMQGHKHWPASTLVDGVPDIENVTFALKNGPYGRCVYECDNNVCDNQVVNLEFSNGATASFTMVAQTSLICERQTRLHFSYGEIVGDMTSFTVTNFRTGQTKKHTPKNEGGHHGGGDIGLIRTFIEAVKTGKQALLGTDVSEVLKSHLTVFAAENSRREGTVVDCVKFEKEARQKYQV
ncbi:NAD(P)-binding protein [Panus rudis PR-1116 ss-1]|nr:NAD(P)-binding protein [Panus rudis PR-1116 ss-1]